MWDRMSSMGGCGVESCIYSYVFNLLDGPKIGSVITAIWKISISLVLLFSRGPPSKCHPLIKQQKHEEPLN